MNSTRMAVSACRQMLVAAMLTVLSGAMGLPLPQAPGGVQAATLEGQRFADTLVLSDRTLRLNGLGLRGVAWIKAFVAGLYLAAPSKEVGQILAMQGPKRLRLMVMLEAPSIEMTKSMLNGVRHNEPPPVQAQLAERVELLAQGINSIGDFQPGDILDLDFVPGRGTELRLNDKLLVKPIEGDDLYRAILKVFIGESPVDRRMKEGLLSGTSS
ncbi:MAG: chalcone isomerase family protein [Pseudomonadota bacterium]